MSCQSRGAIAADVAASKGRVEQITTRDGRTGRTSNIRVEITSESGAWINGVRVNAAGGRVEDPTGGEQRVQLDKSLIVERAAL